MEMRRGSRLLPSGTKRAYVLRQAADMRAASGVALLLA